MLTYLLVLSMESTKLRMKLSLTFGAVNTGASFLDILTSCG